MGHTHTAGYHHEQSVLRETHCTRHLSFCRSQQKGHATMQGDQSTSQSGGSSQLRPSRDLVRIGSETVTNVSSNDFPGYWPNEDHSWSETTFRKNLRVKIGRLAKSELEVDIVGVDASIANALRRVLMAEVPTVAVENVYIWNNTSLVQDEVLSQRLGLIPLQIDPRKVEYKGANDEPTDLNTIVFSLVVNCENIRSNASRRATDPDKLYKNASVFSSSFEWQPKGVQTDLFAEDPPRPVLDDILLVKLRSGQQILLEMHCEKGIGKDHAKWSPVATASYRLLPSINITKPIPAELCAQFAACFPEGVIEVRKGGDGRDEAIVANPRKDTVSREVLRHPEFEASVQLGRIRDHFIFSIESAGQYPAGDLLPEAVQVLRNKVRELRDGLQAIQ